MPWEGTKPRHIGPTTVHAYKRPDGHYASVWTNPSRIYNSNGWSLAPVDMLDELLADVWDELEAQLGVETSLHQARVSRLDVARDFTDVIAPDRLLDRLFLDQMTSKHLTAHCYRGDNGGKTLSLGNKGGGRINLYDKSKQSIGQAPPGTVRFEVQTHGWLTRFGHAIHDVGDITPVAVERLLKERWETSKMGTAVTTPDRFAIDLQEVTTRMGLGSTVYYGILGYAVALAGGANVSALEPSANTRRKWDAIIKEVGTLPCTPLGDGKPMLSYLDFDEGREVVFPAFDEAETVPQSS